MRTGKGVIKGDGYAFIREVFEVSVQVLAQPKL